MVSVKASHDRTPLKPEWKHVAGDCSDKEDQIYLQSLTFRYLMKDTAHLLFFSHFNMNSFLIGWRCTRQPCCQVVTNKPMWCILSSWRWLCLLVSPWLAIAKSPNANNTVIAVYHNIQTTSAQQSQISGWTGGPCWTGGSELKLSVEATIPPTFSSHFASSCVFHSGYITSWRKWLPCPSAQLHWGWKIFPLSYPEVSLFDTLEVPQQHKRTAGAAML